MRNTSQWVRRFQMFALAVGAACSVPVLAQYPTNNQPDSQPRPQPGQQVNQELYGNNTSRVVQHYQTTVLPSEARYAIERSGVTPSELQVQADRVGPLSPGGLPSYIPSQSALQAALGLPMVQLYNPAYQLNAQRPAPTPLPAPQVRTTGNVNPSPMGTAVNREGEVQQSAYFIPAQRLNAAVPISPTIPQVGRGGERTEYYVRPVHPATQPATRPAVSPGERP